MLTLLVPNHTLRPTILLKGIKNELRARDMALGKGDDHKGHENLFFKIVVQKLHVLTTTVLRGEQRWVGF